MVKPGAYKIIWEKNALDELKEILAYISKESPYGAKMVKESIVAKMKTTKTHPFIYAADSLNERKDPNYRAFSVYSYRITYKITSTHIIILRIRHTSREPLMY